MDEQNGTTVNGVNIKLEEEETNDLRTSPDHQNDDVGASQPHTGDGASPGYFTAFSFPLSLSLCVWVCEYRSILLFCYIFLLSKTMLNFFAWY